MTIQFLNRQAQVCQVRIICETLAEALHRFKHLLDISGKQAFAAMLYQGEKLSLRLIPFFGGPGQLLSDLNFDVNNFTAFLSSKHCKQSFELYFGAEQNNVFKEVAFERSTYCLVNGYTVE